MGGSIRNRHEAIGIKQVVRLEWYDFAVDMLLDGLGAKDIRSRLHAFIRERLQSGGFGERGEQTYPKAVTQIMKAWVTPEKELKEIRSHALSCARKFPRRFWMALHWAMTISAYPFWHRVAEQTGRLLMLQESVTQNQIRLRCFEAMGERTTVERNARRVVRSFVVWGVLEDDSTKGCYVKQPPMELPDPEMGAVLVEAVLLSKTERMAAFDQLAGTPALFPFQLPLMTADGVAHHSGRVEVIRYGLDHELLKLKTCKGEAR